MALHVRHPVWILSEQPGAWTFSMLFLVESAARATLTTVIPLQAYALFEDKETVSLVYTLVALVALIFSMAIPFLVATLSRRWTYTLGAVLLMACALLLSLGVEWGQVLAMLVRTSAAAMLNITLNLYIMDNIRKQELVRSEPLRYAVAAVSWVIFPYLGVSLYQSHGVWAPAAVSALASCLLLAMFWYLRLKDKSVIRKGIIKPPNPLKSIGRFASQPRLRLAWLIAFSRSSFWVTFFVYVPILMIEGGYGATAGGIAIAAGNLMLLNNLAVARLSHRFSVRKVLAATFMLSAVFTAATGFFGTDNALVAAIMIVAASFFVAVTDGLGPVPFLRAVHPHERPEMTTVYRTYLDFSELLPPLVYFFAFQMFGFGGAFWALALLHAGTGMTILRYLPRKL